MKLTQTEYKKRETDQAAIDKLLDEYFSSDDVVRYTTLMYRGISTHGVYLIPGLFQRLGSAEEQLRVRAILALKKLSELNLTEQPSLPWPCPPQASTADSRFGLPSAQRHRPTRRTEHTTDTKRGHSTHPIRRPREAGRTSVGTDAP